MSNRPLTAIAADIRADWRKVTYAAKPLLDAMSELDSIDDTYYEDSAKAIVICFLRNATRWHGDRAKAIKAELKKMAGIKFVNVRKAKV